MIEVPPAPPDGMYWLLDQENGGWRLMADDAPELIQDMNMTWGTGE